MLARSQANAPFVISYVGATNDKSSIHHLKVTRPVWGKSALIMDGVQFSCVVVGVGGGGSELTRARARLRLQRV